MVDFRPPVNEQIIKELVEGEAWTKHIVPVLKDKAMKLADRIATNDYGRGGNVEDDRAQYRLLKKLISPTEAVAFFSVR